MSKQKNRNRRGEAVDAPAREPAAKKSLVGALLELPQSPTAEASQIELLSNREALVDGCKGVMEYNENFIRLNLGKMTVRFCGRNLQLRGMSEGNVVIEGFIQSIDFTT